MKKLSLTSIALCAALLSGCAFSPFGPTGNSTRSSMAQPIAAQDKVALLPVANFTDVPQAGLRVEAMLEPALRQAGLTQLAIYPAQLNPETLFEPAEREAVFAVKHATGAPVWLGSGVTRDALRDWLAASTATWRIALGHHPYLSNGTHGNAGTYDNLGVYPVFDGRTVYDFFNEAVCGNVDVYLCGHDHSRQWLADTCRGTELIVSGAGSSVTALPGQNKAHFQRSTLGFVYITIQDRTFTAEFLDASGTSEFTRTLHK